MLETSCDRSSYAFRCRLYSVVYLPTFLPFRGRHLGLFTGQREVGHNETGKDPIWDGHWRTEREHCVLDAARRSKCHVGETPRSDRLFFRNPGYSDRGALVWLVLDSVWSVRRRIHEKIEPGSFLLCALSGRIPGPPLRLASVRLVVNFIGDEVL